MAAKGGDSKQGLIIALVCFVVLALGMGVAAYFGFDGQKALETKEKDAQAAVKAREKSRDWYKYQSLFLKNKLGFEMAGAERQALEALSANKDSLKGDDAAEWDKWTQRIDERLVKERGKNDRDESLGAKLDRIEKELQASRDLLDKAQKDLAKTEAKSRQDKQDYDDATAQLQGKLKDALEQNRKDADTRGKDFELKLVDLGDKDKTIAELRRKMEDLTAAKDKEIKALRLQIKSKDATITKITEQQKPIDFFKYDTPKGTIIQLDRKGELAHVNIGRDDNVRVSQNLTFAIFAAGTAGTKAGTERKGALEIVDVLGPHLSLAKIIDVTDPANNPVVTGDVLINPAWSPTIRTHVALAGLFDLAGEGRDQLAEFTRNLERQGTVIDCYFDLRDLTYKQGSSIVKLEDVLTHKTDYLVLGEQPDFTTTREILKADPRVERKKEILDKISAMQNRAREMGVPVIPLRRFVLMTGYRLPKGLGVQPGQGYDFFKASQTVDETGKPETKKPAKQPAKTEEEKKDDDDK